MTTVTRRRLFGLSIGAAALTAVPALAGNPAVNAGAGAFRDIFGLDPRNSPDERTYRFLVNVKSLPKSAPAATADVWRNLQPALEAAGFSVLERRRALKPDHAVVSFWDKGNALWEKGWLIESKTDIEHGLPERETDFSVVRLNAPAKTVAAGLFTRNDGKQSKLDGFISIDRQGKPVSYLERHVDFDLKSAVPEPLTVAWLSTRVPAVAQLQLTPDTVLAPETFYETEVEPAKLRLRGIDGHQTVTIRVWTRSPEGEPVAVGVEVECDEAVLRTPEHRGRLNDAVAELFRKVPANFRIAEPDRYLGSMVRLALNRPVK